MKPKYGTPEYCLEEAKKKIDEALEKVFKIRDDVGTIMEVKKIPSPSFGSLGSYFKGGYYNSFNPENRNHVDQAFKNVMNIISENLKTCEVIHEANIPAIENNKKTRQKVYDFMSSVGISNKYSVWDYPTPRHKTKQSIDKIAGYVGDVERCVPVSDFYETVKKSLENSKNNFQKQYDELIKKINIKEREEEEKRKKEESRQELARFQVKYETTGGWWNILNIILSKDKYLRLGHYLLKNREDWNDGPDYAQQGLDGFEISDKVDQMIYEDINNLIMNWDGDGRCFRDSSSSYDYLFGISDQKLYEDYCKVKEKVNL